ncbi:MAG: fused MFS/spermidine synthase [Pseudanabaenaceae cyanobacterium bins.68]|nr:fused MFS/spermidine synthase [Pseudanabaenaceae cyanobacterium bins.68]
MTQNQVDACLWVSEYITPWDIYVHGVSKILAYQQTQFQEMYVVESGVYGKGLVLDGKWQSCTGDEFLYHEPLVHPAMVFHGKPEQVLILGGGEGATTREVLRWQTVKRVVMVDIDGEVVEACRQHLPEMHQGSFDDPRFELVIDDALTYLDQSQQLWDVVISDLSDPIEQGPSFKLFTKEYYEKVRRVLSPEGYFVLQAGPVSPAGLTQHARLVKTMETIFPHVLSCTTYASTYGSPWSFIIGSAVEMAAQPEIAVTDQILATQTKGGFRMFDGVTMLGILQIPLHLRQAIASETQIYTEVAPPTFFGKGILGQD